LQFPSRVRSHEVLPPAARRALSLAALHNAFSLFGKLPDRPDAVPPKLEEPIVIASRLRPLFTTLTVFVLAFAARHAAGQIVDNKIPLNYNFHAMAHTTEAISAAPATNADVILYRSIADRGLYIDPADNAAFGTLPIVGATGIGYSLYSTLGYSNRSEERRVGKEVRS